MLNSHLPLYIDHQGIIRVGDLEMTTCCSGVRSAPATRSDQTPDGSSLLVAVIGGGPVGLAAAAHLLGRGLEPAVFEAGPSVGSALRDCGHVPMFSPWRYDVDRACRLDLPQTGVCSYSRAVPSDGIAEATCRAPQALAAEASCCGSSVRKNTAIVEPAQ